MHRQRTDYVPIRRVRAIRCLAHFARLMSALTRGEFKIARESIANLRRLDVQVELGRSSRQGARRARN